MYSFTRSLIGEKLARMVIQVRVVVSTTSARQMPSTPSLYWIPKSGIQSTSSTNWKPARCRRRARQEAERGADRLATQRRQREAERRPADRRAHVARADERHDERADQRQEGDEAQDREVGEASWSSTYRPR